MHILTNEIIFPNVEEADESGILAIGGDLSVERLLCAYRNGIFPWYNEDEPLIWWSPDPRCVLYPDKLRVTKSMKQVLNNGRFRFTINRDFAAVINACKTVDRKDGLGTWINQDIVAAYTKLHEAGFALSAETWREGKLVGGLYGILLGDVFFGESMFSTESNASKFAFINLVNHLKKNVLQLIDCQQKTGHLMSLGAEMISRQDFISQISHLK